MLDIPYRKQVDEFERYYIIIIDLINNESVYI